MIFNYENLLNLYTDETILIDVILSDSLYLVIKFIIKLTI